MANTSGNERKGVHNTAEALQSISDDNSPDGVPVADCDSGEEIPRPVENDFDSQNSSDSDFVPESEDSFGSNCSGCGQAHRPLSLSLESPVRSKGRHLSGHGAGRRQQAANPFRWTPYPDEDPYDPDWIKQYDCERGVLVDTTNFQPVDFFKLFFPDEVFRLMKEQSNIYRGQVSAQGNQMRYPRLADMKEIEDGEMEAFVALQIAMGLCSKPYISNYWSAYWLTRVKFADVMSCNRYENINHVLRFSNDEERVPAGQPGYDPLFKVRKLLNIVDPLYLDVFCPGKNLSLGETRIKFKGRILFRRSNPAKSTRFEIKQFALCEAKSGYALRFLTYTGKDTLTNPDPNLSVAENVVKQLMTGFEHLGHVLYADSFYMSPNIAHTLQRDGIGYVGTVKPGSKFMPPSLHPNTLALCEGSDPVFARSETTHLVACTWHNTKRVSFISTVHTNNTVSKRMRSRHHECGYRTVEKPCIADSYNDNSGGVDIMDQLLGTYCYPHRVSKWYHAVYQRVREVALTNGYIVYTQANQGIGEKLLSPKAFREQVIDGLLGSFNSSVRQLRNIEIPGLKRLSERHFPVLNACSSHRPDCTVCSSRSRPGWKRVQTRWQCEQCGLPMCAEKNPSCFKIYHTRTDFIRHAGQVFYGLE